MLAVAAVGRAAACVLAYRWLQRQRDRGAGRRRAEPPPDRGRAGLRRHVPPLLFLAALTLLLLAARAVHRRQSRCRGRPAR